MNITSGQDPAFLRSQYSMTTEAYDRVSEGLTKREYFAAIAMQGVIAQAGTRRMVEIQMEYFAKEHPTLSIREAIAKESVLLADALMSALNTKEQK